MSDRLKRVQQDRIGQKDMLNNGQTVKQRETLPASKDVAGGEMDSLTDKIRSGEALLRVVAYPWGVGFDFWEPSARSHLIDNDLC